MLHLAAYIPEMIETRRQFHHHPEIAWTEFLTTQTIVNRVRDLGFKTVVGKALFDTEHALGREPQVIEDAMQRSLKLGMNPQLLKELEGYTGCMAIWETGRPGPVTALRFDIDCVNVEENHDATNEANREGFDSECSGLMHACGHDAHAAMGLAVAHWIHDNADTLKGTIKLIFQPAEEGTKGAAGIAYSKNLDDVDYLVGGHIGVAAKLHEVAVIRSGFLATTKMNVTFTGVPAHAGAAAELGRNALMAACSAAMQIMGIARHGQGDTSVNIGTISAGEGRNVVPVHAKMELEVRGKNNDINRYMQETAERMIKGSAESYGVQYKIDIMGMATDIHSDEDLSDIEVHDDCSFVSAPYSIAERILKSYEERTVKGKPIVTRAKQERKAEPKRKASGKRDAMKGRKRRRDWEDDFQPYGRDTRPGEDGRLSFPERKRDKTRGGRRRRK